MTPTHGTAGEILEKERAMPAAQTKEMEIEFAPPSAANVPTVATETAVATVANPDAAIFGIIERAARDPNVDIEKLERLMGLQERMHARQAQLEFDAAMAVAQEEMQPIRKDANNPQTHSKYATYAALDHAIRPIYTKHGFSVTFGSAEGAPENHIRVTCRVAHRGGHSERSFLDMPTDGKGPKGNDVMSKTHATGSGVAYGRRYLLSMNFNLATEDDDGNAAGGHRPGPAGSAGGGGQFRPERRQPMPAQSSANGRRMAEDDPHLVDHDRQKGSMQRNQPTGRPDNVQQWLDNAIGTLKLSAHTVESLDRWWRDNDGERRADGKLPPITWFRENDADGLDELETAFGNAKDTAKARS